MIKVRKFSEITRTSDVNYMSQKVTNSPYDVVYQAVFSVQDEDFDFKISKQYLNSIELNGKVYLALQTYNITFESYSGDTELTGKGNAFKVFTTVLAIVKEFSDMEKPEILTFSAGEPSRKRLYQHFSDSIEKYLPNYSFMGVTLNPGDKDFYFKRNR